MSLYCEHCNHDFEPIDYDHINGGAYLKKGYIYVLCRHCNKESRFMYERRTNFNGDEYINIFA